MIGRNAGVRVDGLSTSSQFGKAGEHLACAELILQGHNAFLADASQPYDIVVDCEGRLLRIQVKTTGHVRNVGRTKGRHVFAFRLHKSTGKRRHLQLGARAASADHIDAFAFVAADYKQVAFMARSELLSKVPGKLRLAAEFHSKHLPTGTRQWGRRMEDYHSFRRVLPLLDRPVGLV